MAKQISPVHRTTRAESQLMTAIDSLIDQLPNDSSVLIDYDFLRDYTVAKLQTHYMQAGERASIDMACTSVCVHRCHYTRRKIGHLKFK